MPYTSNDQLPDGVQHVLPKHAQDIYREAFNSAYEEYKNPADLREGSDREEVSHRVAWSAVKKKYVKGDDERWHQKA
jgi:cation transport regulator